MPTQISFFHAFEVFTGTGWLGLSEVRPEEALQAQLVEVAQHASLPRLEGAPALGQAAQRLWDRLTSTLPVTVLELTDENGLSVHVTQQGTLFIHSGRFSAAHRTYAPRLTEAENRALYGKCANLHGHNYRAAVALPPSAQYPEPLWDEFDHVNLSVDIPDLQGRNVVTEAIAELIARRVPESAWVRVWELPDFFADYHRVDSSYRLGRYYPIRTSTGRLELEVIVRGELDPRTETAYDLGQLDSHCLALIHTLDEPSLRPPDWLENVWNVLAHPARLGSALTTLQLWATRQRRFRLDG